MSTGKYIFAATAAAAALISASPRAAGSPPVTLATRTAAAAQSADAVVTQMRRTGELRVRESIDDTMIAGRTHERLQQFYRGVRVWGAEVARQATSGGLAVSVYGQMYPTISVDTTPTLDADRAIAQVAPAMFAPRTVRSTELIVLPLDSGEFALAYQIDMRSGMRRIVSFVDAHTGALLRQYNNTQRDAVVGTGSGVFGEALKVSATAVSGAFLAEDQLRPAEIDTYDLRGNVTKTLSFLDGAIDLTESDVATSTSNNWTDGADVDAHVYAGYTYDYYFKQFGRRGLDNHDLPVSVIVHPVNRSDINTATDDVVDQFYLNAFYAGDGIVVYGEGLPSGFVLLPLRQTVNYFSAGLDIVTHELSHGVTEFSSGLVYEGESGALNEAFSDIMGVSAKFFYRPAGSGVMQANYELGSDVIRPGGIRSFDNPAVFGDPDHYSKRLVTTDDNGGVHTNCTIIDQAFYLAIEGGTNRTSGIAVQGVGAANRSQIEKVFYRGFTSMLTPTATFSMARAATIQSAADLYGSTSAAYRAVTQAWNAVGVN